MQFSFFPVTRKCNSKEIIIRITVLYCDAEILLLLPALLEMCLICRISFFVSGLDHIDPVLQGVHAKFNNFIQLCSGFGDGRSFQHLFSITLGYKQIRYSLSKTVTRTVYKLAKCKSKNHISYQTGGCFYAP